MYIFPDSMDCYTLFIHVGSISPRREQRVRANVLKLSRQQISMKFSRQTTTLRCQIFQRFRNCLFPHLQGATDYLMPHLTVDHDVISITLKKGTDSVPETSENFYSLTRLSTSEGFIRQTEDV
jgi:hypothetical protein